MGTELYEEISGLNPNYENYILTLLEGEGFGEKALISNREIAWMSDADGFFTQHAEEAAAVSESGILDIDGKRIYAELLGHEKKLVVLGAGHVSMPIIKIGRMIGCRVTCIDDRPMFANNARIAGADQVICDVFMKALAQIPGDGDTYFVIVTRGHRWDQDCLRVIARKPHAYIGLMGSKRRVRIVKEKLAEEGIPREVLDAVYTPIGLAIGAETPEEIAVSVMAEIIEVKNQKKRNFGYPKEILDAILGANPHERPMEGRKILTTIVTRKGSAPREVGTKMLILPDGHCIGTIGGGCVEADVMRRGREMLLDEDPKPILYHVDLTDDAASEEGMVCGGVLDVLMEVI